MENRIIRFCITGFVGTIIDIVLLALFVETFKSPIILANSLSFSVTIVISFLIHKFWTFKDRETEHVKQFFIYLAISLIGLGISNAALFVLIAQGFWYLSAKIVAVLIVVFWSFSANNALTFKNR